MQQQQLPDRLETWFPLVLDNTQVSTFAGCEMKFFRNYLQHLSYGVESVHLVFGGAFAKGLEVAREHFYLQGESPVQSIMAGQEAAMAVYGNHVPPENSNKTPERLWGALEAYFMEWQLGNDNAPPVTHEDGSRGIEASFMLELPVLHPVLGVPLLYSGRADMLTEYAGRLYVEDDKTSGQMTKNWAKQWETRGQFTGYCHGFREAGIPVVGALIRGIAIYKTSYKFGETITMRNEWETKNWYRDMVTRVQAMADKYSQYLENPTKHASEYFGGNWAESCNAYMSPCSYMDSCKNPQTEVFLNSSMEQNIWRPDLHIRQPLQEYLADLKDQGVL